MNKSPSNPEQSPADSEFGRAWKQASHDLGISVESPFALDAPEGEFILPALIHDFGSSLGTLVLTGATRGHDRRAFETAKAAGYFVSILADGYARYDRQLFIDTLDDWRHFGTQPPPWYSVTPWTL